MRFSRALGGGATFFCALLSSAPSNAQGLEYTDIDKAVVRVMALGLSDMVQIRHGGSTYRLARPVGGHGSGTIVDASGLILTAAHVVEGSGLVSIALPATDEALPAEVVFSDAEHDYAFLRVPGGLSGAAAVPAQSVKLKVRSTLYAIGYPLDAKRADPQSTRGVVSGVLPDGRLQLDMSVNPGTSGGPVIDEKERIVGMVVARGDVSQGITNLAFAVPLDAFRSKLVELRASPPAAKADSARRKKLAFMTKRAAEQSGDWLRHSLEADDAESSLGGARELLAQAGELRDSTEALLLAASYLWNWRIVREARGLGGWKVLEQKTVTLCRMASKLEPELESRSTFVAHVLGKLEATPDDPKPFELDVGGISGGAAAAASAAAGNSGEVGTRGRYSLVPAVKGYSTRTAVGAELLLDDGEFAATSFPLNLLWGYVAADLVRVGGTLDLGWGAVLRGDENEEGGTFFLDAGVGAELDFLLGRSAYVGAAAAALQGLGDAPYASFGYRVGGLFGVTLDRSSDSQFGITLRGMYTSRGKGAEGFDGVQGGLFMSWNRFPMENAAWR